MTNIQTYIVEPGTPELAICARWRANEPQRYTEGAIDFLNVIAAQAQLLQSENDLADSDTQIATNLVNLYRSLGGGWEIADAPHGRDPQQPMLGRP